MSLPRCKYRRVLRPLSADNYPEEVSWRSLKYSPEYRGGDTMTDIRLASLQGGAIVLGTDTVADFRRTLRGNVCLPDEAGYDEARTIWNAMINRRPGAVVRCRGAADIVAAVRFAREHGLLLAVRGGGHNIAGNAVCEGGLLIDLSQMRSVRVDSASCTARVEPGATLGDFDKEAQAFGLATPLGINSTTGVAGLTLGGGFGWLSRKFGLAADNLISADVVTAEGTLVRASETENSDLLWALRGGGGNFGVVSSFEFRLHPVGPMVLSGLVVHPFARAKELLAGYRQVASKAPDELTVWVVLSRHRPCPSSRPRFTERKFSSSPCAMQAMRRAVSVRLSRCVRWDGQLPT